MLNLTTPQFVVLGILIFMGICALILWRCCRNAMTHPDEGIDMALSTMGGGMPPYGNALPKGPTPRPRNPWYDEHIDKRDRRGKTVDEIQAMRKTKWEAKREAVKEVEL